MLAQRFASAAIGIPVLLALVWAGGPWYTAGACLIVLIGAYEFQALSQQHKPLFGAALAGLAAAIPAGAFVGADWVLWFALAGLLIPLVWTTLFVEPDAGLQMWSHGVAGIAYVGLLGAHFVLLRELPEGRDWVLLAVFGTFAVDTSAYAVGRVVGRRKLAPRISPAKTVEGTLGGIAGGIGAVLLLNYILDLRLEPALIVPLAALLATAAVVGDLAESMIKRGAQTKDAGNILPGHGGLLDRMDSLLFTLPVVYYYLIWVVP